MSNAKPSALGGRQLGPDPDDRFIQAHAPHVDEIEEACTGDRLYRRPGVEEGFRTNRASPQVHHETARDETRNRCASVDIERLEDPLQCDPHRLKAIGGLTLNDGKEHLMNRDPVCGSGSGTEGLADAKILRSAPDLTADRG
jgi:hypothetical protein